jgi:hexosaminidase
LFKLNRFHWHLTDDQGWRVHIDEYPELVGKGAYRNGTQVGHDFDSTDHTQYGGYFSDAVVRDVVAHAKKLNIEVIPEVDLPGHVQAAVAAYPALGNSNATGFLPPTVATSFGTKEYTLAPTDEGFKFVHNVLSEVMDLVPSDYIHIGGDEVSTKQWQHSPRAQAIMSDLEAGSLAEILDAGEQHNVQALFTRRISEFIKTRKRTPIVWDEALGSGSLPKDAIVMVWRPDPDPRGIAKRAAAEGHRVILAPQWFTYLDHP